MNLMNSEICKVSKQELIKHLHETCKRKHKTKREVYECALERIKQLERELTL